MIIKMPITPYYFYQINVLINTLIYLLKSRRPEEKANTVWAFFHYFNIYGKI